MKKLLIALFFLIFIIGCSSKKEPKSKLQVQLDELDTIYLDKNSSEIEINRYKSFHNKNEFLQLGKLGIKLHIKDMNFNAKIKLKLDSG